MKVFRIIIISLLSLLVLGLVNQYLFCPVYRFSAPLPFTGDKWYNPYANAGGSNWYKCNFHAHSNAWAGLTNGENNDSSIWKRYKELGYDVHCVSEYQKIDRAFHSEVNYISAYEHGFNMRKTHQLVLGARQVTWLDYPLPQTLSNKQYILDRLSGSDSAVIILNHPQLKKAYTCTDLRYLDHYQCIEVLNPSVTSIPQWDAALSAGRPVFIVGDDDTHHINNPGSVGKECTWLCMPSVNTQNILTALRRGHGYAMHIPELLGETAEQRETRICHQLPSLRKAVIHNDTLTVSMNKPAHEIVFIGQEGRQLAQASDTPTASYALQPGDHYVRTAIRFENGTVIFLNPVFRYNSVPFPAGKPVQVDHDRSVLRVLLGLNMIFIWAAGIVIMQSGAYRQRHQPFEVC